MGRGGSAQQQVTRHRSNPTCQRLAGVDSEVPPPCMPWAARSTSRRPQPPRQLPAPPPPTAAPAAPPSCTPLNRRPPALGRRGPHLPPDVLGRCGVPALHSFLAPPATLPRRRRRRPARIPGSLPCCLQLQAADPDRPRFHVHPPQGWMNDPNGAEGGLPQRGARRGGVRRRRVQGRCPPPRPLCCACPAYRLSAGVPPLPAPLQDRCTTRGGTTCERPRAWVGNPQQRFAAVQYITAHVVLP